MSQDRPHLEELLRTVREFIDELAPSLEAGRRYDARVASYLLEMAEREVALSAPLDREDQARLAELLGQQGALSELEQELARRLRAGALDDRLEEVLQAELARVIHKVRIVKPAHLHPTHR